MFQRNQPNWGGYAENAYLSLETKTRERFKLVENEMKLERKERKANLKTFTKRFTQCILLPA